MRRYAVSHHCDVRRHKCPGTGKCTAGSRARCLWWRQFQWDSTGSAENHPD